MVTTLQANTTSIFLSWEEPADNNAPILMYQITLQVVGNGSGNTSVFTSATTELTVTGLTPFTVYSVQVVAVNSIGSSSPSPIRTVMTAGGSECPVCIHMYTTHAVLVAWLKYAYAFIFHYVLYYPTIFASHMSVTCKYMYGRMLLSSLV